MRSSRFGYGLAALACIGCASNGPLLDAQGPLTVTAREVTFRGGDTDPAVLQIRIRNLLDHEEGICEVNLRKKPDGKWSANLILLPNTCFHTDEVTVVTAPGPGDWLVRVTTSKGTTETATVRVRAPITEAAFASK